MTGKEEWVKRAMVDDTVVVELLIRLKQSEAASLSHKSHHPLPFRWGLKQPRSRSRKDADSTRCSPTTPLSWSRAASPSLTADVFEHSSRPSSLSHHPPRSKATNTATSEYNCNSASTKKCRRKKTLAELKEEENILLKESIYLKKEIANVSATFKVQRTRNESLKRIKLDLGQKSNNNPSSTSDECTISKVQTHVSEDGTEPVSDSKAGRSESTGESFFLIPDLNMMPSEVDSQSDALCGMS